MGRRLVFGSPVLMVTEVENLDRILRSGNVGRSDRRHLFNASFPRPSIRFADKQRRVQGLVAARVAGSKSAGRFSVEICNRRSK